MAPSPERDRYDQATGPNPQRTLSALLGAFRRAPADPELVSEIDRLATELGLLPEAIDAAREGMASLRRPGEAADLWTWIASWSRRLGRHEEAAGAAESARALIPGHAAALAELEEAYRSLERWGPLSRVLAARVSSLEEPPAEQAEIYRTLALLREEHLGDLDGALEAARSALRLTPGDPVALALMMRLCRRAQRWGLFVQTGRRALLSVDDAERAALRVELAEALFEQLGRPDQAEPLVEEALATEPGHAGARRLLLKIVASRGDAAELLGVVSRTLPLVTDPTEKAAMLVQAAELGERLGDAAASAPLLRWALQLDPTNAAASLGLLAQAAAAGDWDAVLALGHGLAGRDDVPAEQRGAVRRLMADAAAARGDVTAELAHLRAAAALAPDDAETLAVAADRLFAEGQLAEAARCYDRVLARPAGEMGASDRSRCAYRLGISWRALGELRGAMVAFERAARTDPANITAVQALADVSLEAADVQSAVRWRWVLLRRSADHERKAELAAEIARLCREQLGRPEEARRVIGEVLAQTAPTVPLLRELLEVHVSAGEWQGAVDVLRALADGATGAERAQFLALAGEIKARRLGDADGAAALLAEALDADPVDARSYRRIERLFEERGDAEALADALRRVLTRLAGRQDRAAQRRLRALWRRLGELHLRELPDVNAATTCFEVVTSLSPEDSAAQEVLAELYERAGPAGLFEALRVRARLAGRAADDAELVRQIRAYLQAANALRDPVRSARAIDALVALDAALPEERAQHEREAPMFALPSGVLTDAGWIKLRHPEQDARLGLALGIVTPALARVTPPDEWQARLPLVLRHRRARAGRSTLGDLAVHLAGALDIDRPHVWLSPEHEGGSELIFRRAGRRRAALIAGPDLMGVREQPALAFRLGRLLSRGRADNLALLPSAAPSYSALAALIPALRGLLRIDPVLIPEPQARAARRVASRLTARAWERLSVLLAGDPPDLARWARAAMLTTARAGLAVGQDLAVALRECVDDSIGPIEIGAFEQRRDLVAFALSDELSDVRRELGLP